MVHNPIDPQHGSAAAGPDSDPRLLHQPLSRRWRLRSAAAAAALALTVTTGVGAVALNAVTTRSGQVASASQHFIPPAQGSLGAANGEPVSSASAGMATAQQQVGVVDVDTVLDYGQGKAAGTGIVMNSTGEILTNNHVIADSTAITVTVVSTGATYTASVVGTDPTADVAVLQLAHASGLTPAVLADPAQATAAQTPGTAVTAVGNAGGTDGTPSAATGTVVAADQTITASDSSGGNSENLQGMIEIAAAIQPGDSGGPLYANGAVIGIDTAASKSNSPGNRATAYSDTAAPVTGYAIPITTATEIAQKITSGQQDATIQQGYPAFLGVEISQAGETTGATADTAGAVISGVIDSSPAAAAGLSAGDTIVSLAGQPITTSDQLSAALADHQVGDHITVEWVDASGTTHSAAVTLEAGPAR